MRAGALRHSLTIQTATETQNDHGEVVKAWSEFAVVNGSIDPLSGREFWRSRQVQADVTHVVTIRYLPGVIPKMRVLHGSRVLYITSVLNSDERNRELQLLCKETV